MNVSLTRMAAVALTGAWAMCGNPDTAAAGTSSPAAGVQAGQAPKATVEPKNLALKIVRARLANGLRVVLNEDHSSPTVAVCVTYDVGARNEEKRRSGFAHLFEHMMFQGSRNVPKGGHFTLVSSRGGTLNGTTSSDRTNYFELLPSNALEMGLWLEADRMKTLAVTKENFENQRKVVQEEYRMRVGNAAYATGLIRLKELAYKDYWPYEHDAIGSMEDLDNAKLEWIRAFHHRFYAPNNAVLSVAGDFQAQDAMAMIQRHFGPAEPVDVPEYRPPALPEQAAPRFAEVTDQNARTPGLYQGWVIPPFRTSEHYALEMAGVILGYGDSSVLHQRMVQQESIARNVVTWTYDNRGPDLFVIRSILAEGAEVPALKKAVRTELDLLASSGPTPEQLSKAKQRLQSFFLFGLEGNMPRATQLANYELYWGDANLLGTELKNYFAVSPSQIQAAVKKYLGPEKENTIIVLPASSDAATGQEGSKK